MKHFFILLIGLLCCLNGWADEVKITLKKVESVYGSNQEDERSLSGELVATHDGPQVYIYSEKTLENVCIRVTDANGNAVASEDVDEIQGRYTFYIEDTEVKGTLTLFIQTATESYEGIFSLE